MSRLLLIGLLVCVLAPSAGLAQDKERGRFAELFEVARGPWETTVEVRGTEVRISDFAFDTMLGNQFLVVSYRVTRGESVQQNRVILRKSDSGPQLWDAWVFTSEGKDYRTVVSVKPRDRGVVISGTIGELVVVASFEKQTNGKVVGVFQRYDPTSELFPEADPAYAPVQATFTRSSP